MHEDEEPEEALGPQSDAVREALLRPLGFQSYFVREAGRDLLGFQSDVVRKAGRDLLGFHAAQISGALRSALPIILASQQWKEFHRNLPTMMAGPFQTYGAQLGLAGNAGLAQLTAIAIRQPAFRDLAVSATLTSAGSMVVDAEVTAATESTVEREEARLPARSINVAAFAVVLIWLWALAMPAAQEHLSQEAKDYLNTLWSTLALALAVHSAINANRKR